MDARTLGEPLSTVQTKVGKRCRLRSINHGRAREYPFRQRRRQRLQ